MSAELSRLFLPPATGAGLTQYMQGNCTSWDGVTKHSTVVVGGVAVYTNAPILDSALATMSPGPVLLAFSTAGPIILGRLTIPAA